MIFDFLFSPKKYSRRVSDYPMWDYSEIPIVNELEKEHHKNDIVLKDICKKLDEIKDLIDEMKDN